MTVLDFIKRFTAMEVYELATLGIFMLTLFHLVLVIVSGTIALDWKYRAIERLGAAVAWTWLAWRIFENVQRNWWGAAAFTLYFLTLVVTAIGIWRLTHQPARRVDISGY